MQIRTWMAGARVALVAVAGLAVVAARLGSRRPRRGRGRSRSAFVTDTGGLNDKGFNASRQQRASRAQKAARHPGPRSTSRRAEADYLPNLSRQRRRAYDVVDRGRLPARATRSRPSRSSSRRRSSRSSTSGALALEGQAEERARASRSATQEAATSSASAAARRPAKSKARSRSVGGKKIPSVDNCIAGYQCWRQGGRTSDQGRSTRYSRDFIDSGRSARRSR